MDKTVVAYLVRHGTTVLNSSGMFRGNKNPPLDAQGRRDAHKLADYFKDVDLSFIICSDKARATETAELIGKEHDLPVHKSENLRALNVGSFSGQKRTPESEAALQHYIDNPSIQIPEGESLNDFKARVHPCFKELVDLYRDSGVPPLAVLHSSLIHEIGAVLEGSHKAVLVDPGGVCVVYLDNNKLHAAPIFKPSKVQPGVRADTVS